MPLTREPVAWASVAQCHPTRGTSSAISRADCLHSSRVASGSVPVASTLRPARSSPLTHQTPAETSSVENDQLVRSFVVMAGSCPIARRPHRPPVAWASVRECHMKLTGLLGLLAAPAPLRVRSCPYRLHGRRSNRSYSTARVFGSDARGVRPRRRSCSGSSSTHPRTTTLLWARPSRRNAPNSSWLSPTILLCGIGGPRALAWLRVRGAE
jgi:hypothetical protein